MFVGVDVGGTNTDAVLMDGRLLAGAAKVPTTGDVTTGIAEAISELLAQTERRDAVEAVVVGTTHFTNALLERTNLAPTAVMRLSLPATELLPPLIEWPDGLRDAIGGHSFMVGGGNEFDGREISPLDRPAIRDAVHNMRTQGIRAVAVNGCGSGATAVNTEVSTQATLTRRARRETAREPRDGARPDRTSASRWPSEPGSPGVRGPAAARPGSPAADGRRGGSRPPARLGTRR